MSYFVDDGQVRGGRPHRADERAEAANEAAGAQEGRREAARRPPGAVRQGKGEFICLIHSFETIIKQTMKRNVIEFYK